MEPSATDHLFCRKPFSPATLATVWKVDEWASRRLKLVEKWQQRTLELVRYSGANAGGIHELTPLVVPDQERIDYGTIRHIAADDEVLAAIGAPLEPVPASFPRSVWAARALGDDSLELMFSYRAFQIGQWHVEGFGVTGRVWQVVYDGVEFPRRSWSGHRRTSLPRSMSRSNA